jgi:hypothetical protein
VSVLAMPLSLGNGPGRIEDVEALVRKVVDDRLRQWGARLKELDYEDLVSYLIGVSWELSGRYDVAKDGDRPNFAAYAARILSLRVADWYRQRFGDTRHGAKPVVLSLDAPATLDGHGFSETGADRLVDTLAASTGDPALDRAPDLVGVLERGGRGEARAHDSLGEPPAGGAASRDRSPAGLKKGRVVGTKRPPRRPPICRHCFTTFQAAFTKVNAKLPEAERLSEEQIEQKAARRAQAVRFGSEWACPRCTKLEDPLGKELLLEHAYPNRQARRAVAKKAGANGGKSKARRVKRATQEAS